MNRRRQVCAAAVLVAALSLAAGCSSPLPQVKPDPSASVAEPVLSARQDEAVLAQVATVIDEADAARDPALLDARMTGPALAMRTAEIQLASGLGKDSLISGISQGLRPVIVPTTPTWPRTSYAAAQYPDTQSTLWLVVLDQASADEQYKVWGWVQLVANMPPLADLETGSAEVAPDADDLTVSPTDAVAQYADVLNLGDQSAFASSFGSDQLRPLLAQVAGGQSANMATIQGTFAANFAVDAAAPLHAVRSADGGAVVVGAITETQSYNSPPGAQVAPGDEKVAVFLGGAAVSNVLTVNYEVLVALYIPPTGATDPVQILGAQRQVLSASR